jgi:quinol monooxygenase YgiN
MSVIVTAKVPGDTVLFRKTLDERADDIVKLSEQGRAAGCIHHQFAVGEGFVLVVDEWESPQQFEQFFSSPEIEAIIRDMGGSGAPEITIGEAVASPDRF